MQRMRMLQGTINALTTFNQRRLLQHQVETSFLLSPYKNQADDGDKAKNGKGGKAPKSASKKKRILDSDDESSEEDFFFLEKALKESAELDDVDRRLLIGIVQAPQAEKKRWDKEDPAEIRRRRKEKALARGEEWSDSYDDEDDDDMTKLGDGYGDNADSAVDLLGGKDGKSLMHKVTAARNKALGKGMTAENTDQLLICPPGFDPLKWA